MEKLPEIKYSLVNQKINSRTIRELLVKKGAHMLTADGEPVCVVMSEEEYLSLQGIPINQKPVMRRIDGEMWYKLPR